MNILLDSQISPREAGLRNLLSRCETLTSDIRKCRRIEIRYMPRKTARPSFDQVIDSLRTNGFEVSPFAGTPRAMLVSKYGVAAVAAPSKDDGCPVSLVEHPGILIRGQVARLLDRGYQKFIRTSQFELPATANQLHAIHRFQEELTQLTGGTSLYNESLGTTSDLYQYDRLRGREDEAGHPGRRPWELADGH